MEVPSLYKETPATCIVPNLQGCRHVVDPNDVLVPSLILEIVGYPACSHIGTCI